LPRAEAGAMAQMSGDARKQMAGNPKWTRALLANIGAPLRGMAKIAATSSYILIATQMVILRTISVTLFKFADLHWAAYSVAQGHRLLRA
jgi:hypothetical protein